MIAGFVCPPVVSFLKQSHWSTAAKHLVSLLIATVAGVVGLLLAHQINPPTVFDFQWLMSTVASVHGVSQLVYHTYFSGSDVDSRLTSMMQPPAADVPPVSALPTTVTMLPPKTS